jgi:hypothetical protein
LAFIGCTANAHQFLPTYPKFEQSFIDGVSSVKMELFNKRPEIEYYEVQVFDKDWNKISFASEAKLINIKHLETKKINVYVRNEDVLKLGYVCTESKSKKEDSKYTIVSSRICSKIK